jgi:hypothetical protein
VADGPSDARGDVADARDAQPGPVSCGLCLGNECGTQIFACIQSSACRSTFQCASTKCLSGGKPDLACFLGCASSDPDSVSLVLNLFTCITSHCGTDCASVVGGLGGLGGLGGSGRMGMREAFARWPELCPEP